MALLNPPFHALPLDQPEAQPASPQAEATPEEKRREWNRTAQQRFRHKTNAPNERAAEAWAMLLEARAAQSAAKAAHAAATARVAVLRQVWEQACREQS